MKRLAALSLLLVAGPAWGEERWIFSAEGSVAVPVSAAQRDRFGVGVMPALALYRSLAPWVLVGGRLRAGLLSGGEAPPSGIKDPSSGGFASAGLALRFRLPGQAHRSVGPWLEVAGGGGVTGKDLRPAWEAGLGWGFKAGAVTISPSARVLRVEDSPGIMDLGAATVALAGLELSFGDARREPVLAVAVAPPPAPPPPAPEPEREPEPEPQSDPDQDGDGILDRHDACPGEAEVVNGIDDEDGCPDQGPFAVENDRIVLEEVVLFETNRARIKRSGREVLRAIAALSKRHPEWVRMRIEGHADVRGSDRFNDWLSQTRARRVRLAMQELGFPANQIEAVGYGAHRPRDPSRTDKAHQRNRRVEFVIERAHTTAEVHQ